MTFRIASEIERQFAKVDTVKSRIYQRTPRNLKRYRAAVLEAALALQPGRDQDNVSSTW